MNTHNQWRGVQELNLFDCYVGCGLANRPITGLATPRMVEPLGFEPRLDILPECRSPVKLWPHASIADDYLPNHPIPVNRVFQAVNLCLPPLCFDYTTNQNDCQVLFWSG